MQRQIQSRNVYCSKGFGAAKPQKPSKQSKPKADNKLRLDRNDANVSQRFVSKSKSSRDHLLAAALRGSRLQVPHTNVCIPLYLQIVDRAIEVVEERAPTINPKQAAAGRVDFVKVRDWGSGNQEEVGELQVESLSSTTTTPDGKLTFHEQITRNLEALEAQGSLAVAQPKGAKPLPPFKRWAFAKEHYLQYLTDMLCVYTALESSLESVSKGVAVLEKEDSVLLVAINGFKPLYRSESILGDVANIHKSSSDDGSQLAECEPSPNSLSYAEYLQSLATQITAAESSQKAREAAVKLTTHAYILYLTLLSSGTRIGAAAAERLNLFALDALRVYRSFPKEAGAQPLLALVGKINDLGGALGEEDKDILLSESAKAMQRASLQLTALARE